MPVSHNSIPTLTTPESVLAELRSLRNPVKAVEVQRFFKTGPGQYGEGDVFWGIPNPIVHGVVKRVSKNFAPQDVVPLLNSEVHEVRLTGLLILVSLYRRCFRKSEVESKDKEKIIRDLYIENLECANNWDLVDLSAPKILGQWIVYGEEKDDFKKDTLDTLAKSHCLWRQRVAIVSCMTPIKAGRVEWGLRYSQCLINHEHDLMHKAVGWMLREIGKKDISSLRTFLAANLHKMNRTTLRYAIERMDPDERHYWMSHNFPTSNSLV